MTFIKVWAFVFFRYEKNNCSPRAQHFSQKTVARRRNIKTAIKTVMCHEFTVWLWTSLFSFLGFCFPLIKARLALRFFSALLLRNKVLQIRWKWQARSSHYKQEMKSLRENGKLILCIQWLLTYITLIPIACKPTHPIAPIHDLHPHIPRLWSFPEHWRGELNIHHLGGF